MSSSAPIIIEDNSSRGWKNSPYKAVEYVVLEPIDLNDALVNRAVINLRGIFCQCTVFSNKFEACNVAYKLKVEDGWETLVLTVNLGWISDIRIDRATRNMVALFPNSTLFPSTIANL